MKSPNPLPILRAPEDFNRFHRASRELVFQQAFRLMNCSWDAEEITQEVFIKVWLMKERWVFVHDWKDYLFMMTRNLSLTRLKKRKFQRQHIEDYRRFAQYDDLAHAEQDAAHHEIFLRAVEQLPRQQRLVCRLKMRYNWKQARIAEVLELSTWTVKTQFARAKMNMRKYVKEMVA